MTCYNCGKALGFRGSNIWLDDQGNLCDWCAQERRWKNARRNLQRVEDRRADEVSNTHDHVEGGIGEGR